MVDNPQVHSGSVKMAHGPCSNGASISTLALAATVLATATAADRLGRKPVLIASLVVAIVGDVILAAAPSPEIFLLGRALTGIGLGSVFAATFAHVRFVSRSSQVAAGLGIWAAVQVGVLIVFSLVGGVLVNVSWRRARLTPCDAAPARSGARLVAIGVPGSLGSDLFVGLKPLV